MREIKFRLINNGQIVGYERWNSLAGKWCYDDKLSGSFYIMNAFIPHTDKEQYTGLKDKNGREDIYADDVVLTPNGRVWQVGWNDFYVAWVLWSLKDTTHFISLPIEDGKLHAFKQGNIHENLELLK